MTYFPDRENLKSDNNNYWQECGARNAYSHGECVNWYKPIWKTISHSLVKPRLHTCSNSAVSFLCIYSIECLLQSVLHQYTYTEMFLVAQYNHLSKGEWIDKMQYISSPRLILFLDSYPRKMHTHVYVQGCSQKHYLYQLKIRNNSNVHQP